MNITVSFRFRIRATRDKPDKDEPEPKIQAKDGGLFEQPYPAKIGFGREDDERV